MLIGEKIKLKRKDQRLSVPRLSVMLNIPQDRIYKWESGAAEPKHEDRQKLEKWFNSEIVPPNKASWDILVAGIEEPVDAKGSTDDAFKDKYIRALEELREKEKQSSNEVLETLKAIQRRLDELLPATDSKKGNQPVVLYHKDKKGK